MNVKEKLISMIQDSSLFVELFSDVDGAKEVIEKDIQAFLDAAESYVDGASKEVYTTFVQALCTLHYDSICLDIHIQSNPEDEAVLADQVSELNTLLTASDSPVFYTAEDRDIMVLGQLIFMSLYYSGNPTDQNAIEEPKELTSTFSRRRSVFQLSRKKQRKHLFESGLWHLMR